MSEIKKSENYSYENPYDRLDRERGECNEEIRALERRIFPLIPSSERISYEYFFPREKKEFLELVTKAIDEDEALVNSLAKVSFSDPLSRVTSTVENKNKEKKKDELSVAQANEAHFKIQKIFQQKFQEYQEIFIKKIEDDWKKYRSYIEASMSKIQKEKFNKFSEEQKRKFLFFLKNFNTSNVMSTETIPKDIEHLFKFKENYEREQNQKKINLIKSMTKPQQDFFYFLEEKEKNKCLSLLLASPEKINDVMIDFFLENYAANFIHYRDLLNPEISKEDQLKSILDFMNQIKFNEIEKFSYLNEEFLKLLLEKFKDKNQNSLLCLAVIKNNQQMVQWLLEKKIDANQKNNKSQSPLHLATSPEVIQLLIDNGAEIDAQTQNGWTALHYAAISGSVERAKILIENKANFNKQNNYGQTPLHFAASNGSVEVVKILLKNGADINIKDKSGLIPLDLAKRNNNPEIITLLSIQNKRKSLKEEDKETKKESEKKSTEEIIKLPLHSSVLAGNPEFFQRNLDQKESPIGLKNEDGKTALHLRRSSEETRVLINNSVEIDAENHKGQDDQKSIKEEDKETKKEFEKIIELPLHSAVLAGNSGLVQKILDQKESPIGLKNENGQTALHLAAKNNHLKIAELLIENLENPEDINEKDDEGNTPLHLATSLEMVKLLIDKKANISIQNKKRETALNLAQKNKNKNIINLLCGQDDLSQIKLESIVNSDNKNLSKATNNKPFYVAGVISLSLTIICGATIEVCQWLKADDWLEDETLAWDQQFGELDLNSTLATLLMACVLSMSAVIVLRSLFYLKDKIQETECGRHMFSCFSPTNA